MDYIFVDWGLTTHHLHSSVYEANRYCGDHLAHTTTLATVIPTTPSKNQPSTWRLPWELLLNPHKVKAIKCEAQSLLDDFLEEPECNAGAKWLGWLCRMKRKMKQGQFNRQRHRQELLTIPRRCYVKAKSDLRAGLVEPEVFQTTRDRYTDAKAEQRQSSLDRGFDCHATLNESATAHFLRKPPALKVPITSALKHGVIITNQEEVANVFTSHWRSIMVLPATTPSPDPVLQKTVINHATALLSTDQRRAFDRPICAAELCSVIKAMRKNKSPRLNGWLVVFSK
ncbi:hypothetical protein Ae201684P_019830 [Aphanomyces euteiches]|uniref:Uncharacterized protein n=1 Tax=Aphanomyces euteiches TaxID=100861 RepID=A0A6G0XE62_9STRA|nr:hypothetical protein Ae201684_005860 [Aphanomyces euteiches]KAH9078756.1 hypothetical protein Ae201684P_019830 [Aphanomyces euteiches]